MGDDPVHGSHVPRLLGAAEARPLFDALEASDSQARLALLDGSTRLPLDRSCWLEIRDYVDLALDNPNPSERFQAMEIAARVPVKSIRERLQSVAWNGESDERRGAAFALAQVGDPAAVGPLVELLVDPGQGPEAARLLARLDVSGHDASLRDRFSDLPAVGEDAIERFWLALALARTGEDSELVAVLDGLRAGEELPILWGDPGVVAAELSAGPPLPTELQGRLEARAEQASGDEETLVRLLLETSESGAAGGLAPESGAAASRAPLPPAVDETRLQVAAAVEATELFDEQGWPHHDRRLELEAVGRELDPTVGKSARLSLAVSELFKIAVDVPDQRGIGLGNDVAALATEPEYAPDLEGLFEAFQLAEDRHATTTLGAQIGWAASRAAPDGLLAGLEARLAAPETRLTAARLVTEAGTYLQTTYPPIFGGAPVPPEPAVSEGLIDDTSEKPEAQTEPPSEPEPAEPDASRWLLARVRDVETGAQLRTAFRSAAKHEISVAIGAEDTDSLAAKGSETFDQALGSAEHLPELLIVFTPPPPIGNQQKATMVLPPSGTSAASPFYVDIPGDCETFEARTDVYHGNRLVQTAILRGPVVTAPEEARDSAITFELAVIAPVTSDLASRRPYDAAFTKTATTTTGVADDLIPIDVARIDRVVPTLVDLLTTIVTSDAARQRRLDDPEVVGGLRALAGQGRLLYEAFTEQLGDRDLDRLQVVVEDATDFFPVEFVYDLPAPDNDAGLCPGWKSALKRKDGKCSEQHEAKGPLQRADHVCPTGFWSLSKVIERQVLGPQSWRALDLHDAEFAVRAHPRAGLDRLLPPAAVVFGASNRVDAVRRGRIARVRTTLGRIWANTVPAETWTAWVEAVATHRPSLLVLLSHTSTAQMQSALEIGQADLCQLAQLGPQYIRTSADDHPIVLLLGCETAVSDFELQTFVARFQDLGAAVVVGTVASVLGERVASVAQLVAREIARASTAKRATSTGELMRHVRRKLLAQGELTSLCLTAFGDAQWQIGG